MADDENGKVEELAKALASSSLTPPPPPPPHQEAEEQDQRETTIDDLPNDVLVTIFFATRDPRWVTATFPFVCRAWRDLYRTRDASPLHHYLAVDLGVDRASRVLAWARRYAADVRTLRVEELGPGDSVRDFSEGSLAALVSAVGPGLEELSVAHGCGSLLRARFWAAVEGNIVAADRRGGGGGCQLSSLFIQGIRAPLPRSLAEALGRCPNLRALQLCCDEVVDVDGRGEGAARSRRGAASSRSNRNTWGFSSFPNSVLALTQLEDLILGQCCCGYHRGIASLPPGISALKNLKKLYLPHCSLRSLPAELGELSRLDALIVGHNKDLGAADEAEAFPAALGGMTSLRHLCIEDSSLRTVPSFIGNFKLLEKLYLSCNDLGSAGAAAWPSSFPKLPELKVLVIHSANLSALPPAFLSSLPGLVKLYIGNNRLRELPEDFGRRLQRLEYIDLSGNELAAVPVAALAGAAALEDVDLRINERLQVEAPLDALLDNHPRLRRVRLWKRGATTWSMSSRRNIVAFAAKIKERDPEAPSAMFEPVT